MNSIGSCMMISAKPNFQPVCFGVLSVVPTEDVMVFKVIGGMANEALFVVLDDAFHRKTSFQ